MIENKFEEIYTGEPESMDLPDKADTHPFEMQSGGLRSANTHDLFKETNQPGRQPGLFKI